MIHPNTVFVLGAGASIDYGLPRTEDIRALAANLEPSSDVGAEIAQAAGCSTLALVHFKRAFDSSPYYSIDAFLQKRPDDEKTQGIGKAIIASAFLRRHVRYRLSDGDWLRHLIVKMLDGAPAWPQFLNNRVSFISFNFDTLVEDTFKWNLASAYPNLKNENVSAFIDPRVFHIHGALPPLPNHLEGFQGAWLREAVTAINVIHEPGSENAVTAARRSLLEAHVVCFLGFGYHDENLKKIGFEPGAKPAPNAEIFCCGYRVTPSDRAEAFLRIQTGAYDRVYQPGPTQYQHVQKRHFGHESHKALEFLEQHHILKSSI